MDVCLRVLKESNKRRFDSYSVWNSVLIISHITFRDRRVHIFADNLSRNSCIHKTYMGHPSLQAAMNHSRQNYNKAIRDEISREELISQQSRVSSYL